jgi:hypothetical protein
MDGFKFIQLYGNRLRQEIFIGSSFLFTGWQVETFGYEDVGYYSGK